MGPFFLSLSCRLMLAALVVLIMIAITNYSALFFCCFATDYYGLWLQTYHRKDLACLRVLVRQTAFIQHTADKESLTFLRTPSDPVYDVTFYPYMLICPGPEWFGSLHHMDIHCLSDQLLIGSPPVGCGQKHSSNSVSVHPVWRGGCMVSPDWMRLNDGHFQNKVGSNSLYDISLLIKFEVLTVKVAIMSPHHHELNQSTVSAEGVFHLVFLMLGRKHW